MSGFKQTSLPLAVMEPRIPPTDVARLSFRSKTSLEVCADALVVWESPKESRKGECKQEEDTPMWKGNSMGKK